MASPSTLTFTDANFDAEVLQSEQPVLVDFWAAWCGPCRMIAPAIDEIAGEFAGQAKVGKLDVDTNQATAIKFGITNIPAVLVFKGGKAVKTIVGAKNKREYADAIRAAASA